jgi:GMP synthase (glutamine-hydrolysing)
MIILVVDFGSQVAHLISRRLSDVGAKTKIILPEDVLMEIKKEKPLGIILSGGPDSVYAKGAPTIDKQVFNSGTPILGICYGLQLMMH